MRLWYITTSIHLWRFYFRYANADPAELTESSRLNWQACDRAIKSFSESEVELLRRYYMTDYGKYEDMVEVFYFAKETGIKESEAWNIIKRANYEVIVERGLMERKE